MSCAAQEGTGAEALLLKLFVLRRPIIQVELPERPGVYALFLADEAALPRLALRKGQPIYIGMSENLAQRQFDSHFDSAQTGWSTVRRSIGAMLKEELRLTARPRGHGGSARDCTTYRFEGDGEERLSKWM